MTVMNFGLQKHILRSMVEKANIDPQTVDIKSLLDPSLTLTENMKNLRKQLPVQNLEMSEKEIACMEEQIQVAMPKTTLEDVHETFAKWYYIEDFERIDVALAVLVNRRLEGERLWLFLVGPSGEGKSTLIEILSDDFLGEKATTKIQHRLTPKTLVSGLKGAKGEKFDLAPKLDGKVWLFPDFSEILKLPGYDKAQIFAQFRLLYDGEAQASAGSGVDRCYKNLKVDLLAGATSEIYDQFLIHNQLGTRELLLHVETKNKAKLRERAKYLTELELDKRAKKECSEVVRKFLNDVEIRDVAVPEFVHKKIDELTTRLSYMRVQVKTNRYTGELVAIPEIEQPTRLPKQFVQLYKCLKLLDPTYSDDKIIGIFERIVASTSDQVRQKVHEVLKDNGEWITTNEIAKTLRLGHRTVLRQLNIMWNIRLVERNTNAETVSWRLKRLSQKEAL